MLGLDASPVGVGLGMIDQRVPFQCSTNVKVAELVSWVPTAKQLVRVGHDTALNSDELRLGLTTIDHRVPFQCSTKVRVVVEPVEELPTAKQLVGLTHATPPSVVRLPGLAGIHTTHHLDPSQRAPVGPGALP